MSCDAMLVIGQRFERGERGGAWDVTLLETCEGQERGSLEPGVLQAWRVSKRC